jgi:hypothetical protein
MTTPHFIKPTSAFDNPFVPQDGAGVQAANIGANPTCYTKDLSSVLSNSQTGSVFFWVYFEPVMAADATVVSTVGLRFAIQVDSTGTQPDDYEMFGQDTTPTAQIIVDGPPAGTGTPQGVWVAFFHSWDTATANGAEMWLQQQGQAAADIKDDESNLGTNAIDYTDTWIAFCQDLAQAKPLINARLSQFWFSTMRLDFSQAGIREDFVTAAGQPVDLGPLGDAFGHTPEVWWPAGDPAFDGFTLASGPGVTIVENGPAA